MRRRKAGYLEPVAWEGGQFSGTRARMEVSRQLGAPGAARGWVSRVAKALELKSEAPTPLTQGKGGV